MLTSKEGRGEGTRRSGRNEAERGEDEKNVSELGVGCKLRADFFCSYSKHCKGVFPLLLLLLLPKSKNYSLENSV